MPFFRGYHTESAGTAIVELVPPVSNRVTIIESIRYRTAATAHTITILRPIAKTKVAANAPTVSPGAIELEDGSPGLDSNGDAESLAASDYLIWQDEDGQYQYDTIASLSTNTVTLSNALPSDVKVGAPVWALYELGRSTHDTLSVAANTTADFLDLYITSGIADQFAVYNRRDGKGDPLLISIDNATNAGFLDYVSGTYGVWPGM